MKVNENAALGERVRRLRLMSGMTQSDLGRELGFSSNTLVSRVENGRSGVEPHMVERLAAILRCGVGHLQRPLEDPIATKPWLRAYADAPVRVVDSVVAENLTLHEAITTRHLHTLPDALPIFDGDRNDDDAIERFAVEVRAAASLNEGEVIRNVVRAAERLGCIIVPLPHELGRHLGLSHRIDDRPIIRVARATGGGTPGMPGDRQRHTVAHELGHLGLHAALPPAPDAAAAKRIEKEAHLFAAAFLAPAEALLDDWHAAGARPTLQAFAALKATWGISIKALVTRFRQLQIIDDEKARSLYKQISARGWNTIEPVEVPNERGVWLTKACVRAFGVSPERASSALAAELDIAESYVKPWFEWQPFEPELAKVVSLKPRTTEGRSGATSSRFMRL